MAAATLQGHVRELIAHRTADLIDQLLLEFILDFVHFDVDGRHWVGSHDLVNRLLREDQVESLGRIESLLICIHLLRERLLTLVDWHGSSDRLDHVLGPQRGVLRLLRRDSTFHNKIRMIIK